MKEKEKYYLQLKTKREELMYMMDPQYVDLLKVDWEQVARKAVECRSIYKIIEYLDDEELPFE